MAVKNILIAVKTYPTLSEKYDELVCTAGFLEDGSWVRIYPIPYRKLDYTERYQKWHWISLDIEKNPHDFRKESFRPVNIDGELIIGKHVGTQNNWAERKNIVLKHVYTNMEELISEAKNNEIGTSLAVLKPKEVVDFVWEACKERDWDKKKLDKILARQTQLSLFEEENETRKIFKVVQKVPYEFSYIFTTEDGIQRKLMIEDWEVGELYWNCLRRSQGNEEIACQQVKKKYFDKFVKENDLYFFLGTTLKYHNFGKNPFIIIGVFYPKKEKNQQMFFDF